ncbi:2'-5' RNA ligase family protein [Bradyrhizobium prioriisuperbiae]|uniref:2'-5' RNA ligase family protein n=1 Tax=Bradyrhizobium prioriisuperbiae TaxID=2854389 RepID=UPI0028E2D1ED|nr:2'-5' RNA ligase family protein [Bradyrhizobium prioritasuperba]
MAWRRRSHPNQLQFDFGGGPAEPNRDPVFFANLIDPTNAAALGRVAQAQNDQFELQGALRPTRNLHLSLNPIGHRWMLDDRLIDIARQAASTVEMSCFDLVFDRVMSFKTRQPYPLVLRCGSGSASVIALYRAIGEAMAGSELRVRAPLSFTPHVTLLYGSKLVPATALDEPVMVRVRDFTLVHSLHGQSLYKELGRWPLRANV